MTEEHQKILIHQIAKNDDLKAFKMLFDHYFERLFNYSRSYVKNEELAEEVVADVLHNIWANRSRLIEVKNIKTYLYVAVKNQSLKYIEKYMRTPLLVNLDNEYSFDWVINNNTPEADLLSNELLQKLNEAIEELPHQCKITFKLVKNDGLKYKEVAEILGITVKGVEKQMVRAHKKIRAQIEYYLNDGQIKDDKNDGMQVG